MFSVPFIEVERGVRPLPCSEKELLWLATNVLCSSMWSGTTCVDVWSGTTCIGAIRMLLDE